jgi:uncharacterized protein (TIRG00374 family)
MNLKKQFNFAAKILLSAIILAYLLYLIPLNEIINSILTTELYLFAAGILAAVPISYLSALETQYLTRVQGLDLSVPEILKIHLATSFYGFFLPGTLPGGAVKWYKFSRFGKKSSAAAVVVFNRFLETLMIVFIGIIFSIPALYSSENQKLLIVLILILFAMIMLYFLLLSRRGINIVLKILFIFPLPHFLKEKISRLTDAMLQFQNLMLKDHLEIIGLLFLYHAIGVFSFFCFARSLDINLSIWDLGWIRSAMSLAVMLPLSFAGLGIREGTLVFLFGQYGIKPDVSMALSFLFFSKNIMTSLLGGLLEFKDFIQSKKIRRRKLFSGFREE